MEARLEAIAWRHLDGMTARKLSGNTVRNRRTILTRLAAWARQRDKTLLYLTPEDLQRWQADRSRNLSAGALRVEIVNVQIFYRWALKERLIDADPSEHLERPRPQRRLPRPVEERDFRALLAAANDDTKVILCLSGFAGLRAGEIASLTWSDVDLGAGMLRVQGKGDKDRVVPVAKPLAEVLARLPHRAGPVVRRLDGGRGACTPDRVSTRAAQYARMLGLQIRLHQLRHRFATMALEGSGNVRVVQELLGHERVDTTAIYTRVRPGALKDAVEAAAKLWDEAP